MIPSPAELSFGETRIHISYVEIPRSCVSSVLNYCIFVSYCAVATFHVTRAQLESKDYGIISTLFEPKHGYHFDRPYSHLVHTHTLSRREPRQRPKSFAFYDTRNPPSSLISLSRPFQKYYPWLLGMPCEASSNRLQMRPSIVLSFASSRLGCCWQ